MRCGELRERLGGDETGDALVTWSADDDVEVGGTAVVRGLIAISEVEGLEEVRLIVDDPRGAPMSIAELAAGLDRLAPAPDEEVTVAVRGPYGVSVHPVVDLDAQHVRFVGPAPEADRAIAAQPRTSRSLVLSGLLVVSAAVVGVSAASHSTERVAPAIEDDGGRRAAGASSAVVPSTTSVIEVPPDSAMTVPAPAPSTEPEGPSEPAPADDEVAPVPGTGPQDADERREVRRRITWPAVLFAPPVVEEEPPPRPSGPTSPPVRRRPTTTRRVRPTTSTPPTVAPTTTPPPVTEPPTTEAPPTTEQPSTTETPVPTEPPPDPPPEELV